mmetsp:Transcript_31491/g.35800  ORF Transcript_31491/g.35800 Transcript_31491/m.35800 type:complete len:185 (+) Transcript_31491:22-576(+)
MSHKYLGIWSPTREFICGLSLRTGAIITWFILLFSNLSALGMQIETLNSVRLDDEYRQQTIIMAYLTIIWRSSHLTVVATGFSANFRDNCRASHCYTSWNIFFVSCYLLFVLYVGGACVAVEVFTGSLNSGIIVNVVLTTLWAVILMFLVYIIFSFDYYLQAGIPDALDFPESMFDSKQDVLRI